MVSRDKSAAAHGSRPVPSDVLVVTEAGGAADAKVQHLSEEDGDPAMIGRGLLVREADPQGIITAAAAVVVIAVMMVMVMVMVVVISGAAVVDRLQVNVVEVELAQRGAEAAEHGEEAEAHDLDAAQLEAREVREHGARRPPDRRHGPELPLF